MTKVMWNIKILVLCAILMSTCQAEKLKDREQKISLLNQHAEDPCVEEDKPKVALKQKRENLATANQPDKQIRPNPMNLRLDTYIRARPYSRPSLTTKPEQKVRVISPAIPTTRNQNLNRNENKQVLRNQPQNIMKGVIKVIKSVPDDLKPKNDGLSENANKRNPQDRNEKQSIEQHIPSSIKPISNKYIEKPYPLTKQNLPRKVPENVQGQSNQTAHESPEKRNINSISGLVQKQNKDESLIQTTKKATYKEHKFHDHFEPKSEEFFEDIDTETTQVDNVTKKPELFIKHDEGKQNSEETKRKIEYKYDDDDLESVYNDNKDKIQEQSKNNTLLMISKSDKTLHELQPETIHPEPAQKGNPEQNIKTNNSDTEQEIIHININHNNNDSYNTVDHNHETNATESEKNHPTLVTDRNNAPYTHSDEKNAITSEPTTLSRNSKTNENPTETDILIGLFVPDKYQNNDIDMSDKDDHTKNVECSNPDQNDKIVIRNHGFEEILERSDPGYTEDIHTEEPETTPVWTNYYYPHPYNERYYDPNAYHVQWIYPYQYYDDEINLNDGYVRQNEMNDYKIEMRPDTPERIWRAWKNIEISINKGKSNYLVRILNDLSNQAKMYGYGVNNKVYAKTYGVPVIGVNGYYGNQNMAPNPCCICPCYRCS